MKLKIIKNKVKMKMECWSGGVMGWEDVQAPAADAGADRTNRTDKTEEEAAKRIAGMTGHAKAWTPNTGGVL